MRRAPIFGIDAARFFAAVAVVMFHLGYQPFATLGSFLQPRIGPLSPPPPLSAWWGWVGVQIFFVVSGLVIAYSAADATPAQFLRSRVGRLLPAMLICATFVAIVCVTWAGTAPLETAVYWLRAVVFFPMGPYLAGPFWTLGVEVFFYGVVLLMIVFNSVGRLERLAWGLALASSLYWAAIASGLVVDPIPRTTELLLIPHGCFFAFGILLSAATRSGMSASRWTLAGLCIATAWLQIAAATANEAPAYAHGAAAALPFAIWLMATAVIAASLYWRRRIADLVGRSAGLWRTLGLATYPLYLIHMHAGGPVVVAMARAGWPHAAAVTAGVAVSVIAALAVTLWLEPVVRRSVLWTFDRLAAHRPTRQLSAGA